MIVRRIIFIILGAVVLVGGVVWLTGFYPMAAVDGHLIMAGTFRKYFNTGTNYYKETFTAYKKDTALLYSKEFNQEMNLSVLNSLIQKQLVHKELLKLMNESNLRKAADDKIATVMQKSDIQKGVETLYGLSMGDFKEIILRPQAEEEILQAKLVSESKSFNDWLKEAESQSKISIFMPGFYWDKTEVKAK